MTSASTTVGRYALHHEIASGGMAVVHLGRLQGAAGFARTVAIKRLHAHLARDPEFVAMFLDEARLAARIRHPNVVSTLDVVSTEGELFVVMEYVTGEALSRLVHAARERGERVPLPVAASIAVDVLRGLHAAHEARDEQARPLGLVHRDVSPHNVLVGVDGAAHVIDFGVAKANGRAQVTREGQLKGKLAYMSPEQLSGQPADRRADVFGASVVFWEMLTGRRLFDGADEGEIYGKVKRADVAKPSKVVAGVGKADAVVLKGLARNPDRRFPSARAMADAIEKALPLATATEVGAWVARLGGEELAARARLVASVEGLEYVEGGPSPSAALTFSSAARPTLKPDAAAIATAPGGRPGARIDESSLVATRPNVAASPDSSHTNTSLVAEDRVSVPGARPRRSVALAGAALLAGLGVTLALVRSRGPDPSSASASASALPSASAPPAASAAPQGPRVVPAADDAVDPLALPAAPLPRPGRALPARKPPPGCDPPYTIDASGYKKYKRECATW